MAISDRCGRFSVVLKVIGLVCGVLVLSCDCLAQTTAAGVPLRKLTVESEPAATVWIDGVRFGKTGKDGKLLISSAPPGRHSLVVRADGFHQKDQILSAIQAGTIRVVLTRTEDPAELAYQEAERLTTVDREKAADAYNRAIKLRPAYLEAMLGLARVLSDAGDLDAAKSAVMSARKIDPTSAEASVILGRIYKDDGEEALAIASFKRSIAEGKGFQPEAYTGLGLLYKEKAEGFGGAGDFANEKLNYDEASKNLKAGLKQLSGAPDAIILYQLLGLIYERQKRTDDAISTYEEFLRIFPDTPEATAVRSFIVQLRKNPTPQD